MTDTCTIKTICKFVCMSWQIPELSKQSVHWCFTQSPRWLSAHFLSSSKAKSANFPSQKSACAPFARDDMPVKYPLPQTFLCWRIYEMTRALPDMPSSFELHAPGYNSNASALWQPYVVCSSTHTQYTLILPPYPTTSKPCTFCPPSPKGITVLDDLVAKPPLILTAFWVACSKSALEIVRKYADFHDSSEDDVSTFTEFRKHAHDAESKYTHTRDSAQDNFSKSWISVHLHKILRVSTHTFDHLCRTVRASHEFPWISIWYCEQIHACPWLCARDHKQMRTIPFHRFAQDFTSLHTHFVWSREAAQHDFSR